MEKIKSKINAIELLSARYNEVGVGHFYFNAVY